MFRANDLEAIRFKLSLTSIWSEFTEVKTKSSRTFTFYRTERAGGYLIFTP